MIRLAVRVGKDDAELVLAELLDLAPAGVEERELDGGVVEYAIYGAPGEVAELGQVEAVVGERLVAVEATEVPDDWRDRWKAWHRPVEVSWRLRRLRVRPPWEAPSEAPDIELVIDPGQAFGTGAHATTRLCLELLLAHEPAGGAFADWGAGSGVLALAAARLGYGPILAVDHERASLEAIADNARANGIEGIEVGRVDLRREPAPYAPTVAANLVRPLLLEVCERIERPPATLIVSGLLREEVDEVAGAFARRHGYVERERREATEWAAALLVGPDVP